MDVGLVIVLLMIAGGVFALGYLLGQDVADAETAIQVEALERTERIRAATLATVEKIVQATKTPE